MGSVSSCVVLGVYEKSELYSTTQEGVPRGDRAAAAGVGGHPTKSYCRLIQGVRGKCSAPLPSGGHDPRLYGVMF